MLQDPPINSPFPLLGWLAANADQFAPPVSNRVLWADREFIAMVVRGPNARNDFHVDPGDEIFLQLSGAIRVDVMVDGVRRERIVGEGEMMLVPGGTPHAPMRPADTWGLVIERPRVDGELDLVRWYCERCSAVVHEVAFSLSDIETQIAEALGTFNDDEALRTCGNCGEVVAIPEPFDAADLAGTRIETRSDGRDAHP